MKDECTACEQTDSVAAWATGCPIWTPPAMDGTHRALLPIEEHPAMVGTNQEPHAAEEQSDEGGG